MKKQLQKAKPRQRKAESKPPLSGVDRDIAESLKDLAEGRYYGPFNTPEEMIQSLHEEAKKLKRKRP